MAEKVDIPAFAIAPACNHDPIRGRIDLVMVPVYSDEPQPGIAYLRCAHCCELMGMIGAAGGTQGHAEGYVKGTP